MDKSNSTALIQLQVIADWVTGFIKSVKQGESVRLLNNEEFLQNEIDLCYAKFQPQPQQIERYADLVKRLESVLQ